MNSVVIHRCSNLEGQGKHTKESNEVHRIVKEAAAVHGKFME